MMITKKALPRRTVLRGIGAALALPLLDGMVPAFAAIRNSAAHPVRRFGVVYVPNGMAMKHWTPETEGAAFEITRLLKPLESYRDQMTVLTGLNGVASNAGVHASAATRFLTGVTPARTESNLRAGVSVDQLIAREFAKHTQLASLEIALDSRDVSGSCDVGFSCTYTNTISWRSETTPLLGENNPRAVFERLFGDAGSTDPAARLARIKKDQSILDSVTEKINALQQGLGPNDRLRVDEYLEAVRDIERRIQKAEEHESIDFEAVSGPLAILRDRLELEEHDGCTVLRYHSTIGVRGWIFGWLVAALVIRPIADRHTRLHLRDIKEATEARARRSKVYPQQAC